jgi:PAS domain S-box-containing protein
MSQAVLHVRPQSVGPSLSDSFPLVVTAATWDGALTVLADTDVECVVVDGALDGAADVLERLAARTPELPVVATTATPDPAFALVAAETGAEYYPRTGEGSLADRIRDGSGGAPGPGSDAASPPGDDADGAAEGVADGAGAARATDSSLPADSGAFEAIANSTSEAILTIDADSTIVYANDGVETVTGHTPEQLLGESLTTLIPERFHDAHHRGVETYLAEGERTIDWSGVELPVRHAEGHEVHARISFGEFERDGEVYFTGLVRDITDRVERERDLEETKTRLELALEGAGSGVFDWAVDDGEIRLEGPAVEFAGLGEGRATVTPAEFVGMIHPEDRDAVRGAAERARRGGRLAVTCRVTTGEETRWVEIQGEPADDDHDRVVGVVHDVTDRERARREQERNQEALRSLQALASDPSLSLDERVDRALEAGSERLGLDVAFLTDIDPEADELRVTHARGDHPGVQAGVEAPLSRAYCRRTVDGPGLTEHADVPVELGTDPAYEDTGLACYLGARITVDDELRGTLCFADTDPRVEFSEGERTFIELLAEWVSHELERERREAELAAARERAERVFERIDDAFFALDTDWEFTYINGRAEAVLDVTAEAVLGERVWDVFEAAVDTQFEREYRRAMEDQEPTSFESYYPPLDLWFEVSAYPAPDGLSVYFRDITERKRYREALANLHDTTRSLMAASTVEDVIEVAVTAAEETLGYDAGVRLYDEETDSLWLATLGEGTGNRVEAADRPTYAPGEGGAGRAFEHGETVRREGEAVDVEEYEAAVYAPLGEHGTMSIGAPEADAFTEYTQPLVELLASNVAAALDRVERESELRTYETVLESVQDMVYVCGSDGRLTYVTEPLAAWLGRDRDDLVGTPLADVLAAPDRAVSQAVDRLRAGDADSASAETALRSADGEQLPVTIDLSLYPGEGFAGTVGVVRDRSELLATERALQSERERFSYLFDSLSDAVVDVVLEDGRQVVESVNDAFEEVFGYDAAAVVGEDLDSYLLREGEEPVDLPEALATGVEGEAGEAGRSFTAEVRRQTADGPADFLFRGVPFADADGTTHVLGIYTDITEQKRRERRLEVLNRVLRHNLRNDLAVILGYVEHLAATLDGEEATLAEKAAAKATEVADVADRAREIEKVAGADDRVPRRLRALVEDGVGRVTVPGDATVTTEVDEGVEVRADERLTLVVTHLVENAIEHNDGPATVRVSGGETETGVTVAVADDGPGLPDAEWAVVAGETPLTQLSHASGLGLWLMRWVVEAYGGRFERAESELGGTVVRLHLPA